jgi:2-polyprenyl-6-methoxyphenol hydroxylase-like FAD-dependent oxidoreductase
MNKRAIIIGAGIAGPAMALQLKRMGIEAIVFEARQEAAMSQGVFLGITPNGLNVLKKMIDIQKLKEEFTPGKMVFYNANDQPIGELDTKHQLEKYGAETLQIKRTKISEELRKEALNQEIHIQYGYRLSGLEEKENAVTVYFDNGEKAEADFLIACDGAHSVCRKILFPNAPKPIYTQQLSTGATVQMNGSTPDFGQIKMVFGKQAFFAYAVSNWGEVWWFNNFYREKEPSRKEMNTTLQQEIKSYLLQIHKNDPEPIVDIIQQTDHIFAYPIYEMPSLCQWHSERVCLIGDAAHATAPHIGQGASLALEDTIVLANCIRQHKNLWQAFAEFQALRQPRVEKLIKSARKIGNQKSKPNPMATFFRNLFLRYFIKFEIRKMDWVYGYNVDVNSSVVQ